MPKVCKLKEIKGKKYRCYFELALLIIGGKWKPVILFHLAQGGVMRFSELRRGMPGITERMLARQLRELEKDGLVSRQVFREVPPRVEYRLTPQGCAVIPALLGLREWGVVYERHLGGPGRFEGGDYESPEPVVVNPECLAQAELVRQGVEIPPLPKAKAGRGRKAEPKAPAVEREAAMAGEPEAAPEPISEPNQELVSETVVEMAPHESPAATPEPGPVAGLKTEEQSRDNDRMEPIFSAAAEPDPDDAQAMDEGFMPAETGGTIPPGSMPEPVAARDCAPEAAIPAEAPALAPGAAPEPTPAMVPAPAQETAPAVVPETPLAIRPESPAAVFLRPVPALVPAPPGEAPEPEPAPKPERSGPSLLDFV